METRTTESLAQFCIAQRSAFDCDDWYLRFASDGEAVALAARYLSLTDWYGHEEELERIASKMHFFVDTGCSLYRESQVIGFDLPYFSARVHPGSS